MSVSFFKHWNLIHFCPDPTRQQTGLEFQSKLKNKADEGDDAQVSVHPSTLAMSLDSGDQKCPADHW